ncbi:MAG: glycosyltransferase family 39 protein [Oscillochloris sp.]|nr:glycosyltransferase family 39 protein [Oscillochloris sp.]
MQRILNPPHKQSRPLSTTIGTWPIALSLGLLALILAFVNLSGAPAPWFDEGSHLHVPKTLISHGVYADISSEGFRYFGPTIGVGPTVMLPIAAAFQIFGVSFLTGRFVIALYLLLALTLAFILARRLHGTLAAGLSVILLLASRTIGFDGMVEYGRQVLGEVPGIAFLLLGAISWSKAITTEDSRRRTLLAALAGLSFGLALITKTSSH